MNNGKREGWRERGQEGKREEERERREGRRERGMEEKMEGGRKHKCRNSFKIGRAITLFITHGHNILATAHTSDL